MRSHFADILSVPIGLCLIISGLTVFAGFYLVLFTDRDDLRDLGWALVGLGGSGFLLAAFLASLVLEQAR